MNEPNSSCSNKELRDGMSYKPHASHINDPYKNFEEIRTLVKANVCIYCSQRQNNASETCAKNPFTNTYHVWEEKAVRK